MNRRIYRFRLGSWGVWLYPKPRGFLLYAGRYPSPRWAMRVKLGGPGVMGNSSWLSRYLAWDRVEETG